MNLNQPYGSSDRRQFPTTSGTLHLDVHPLLQTGRVEEMAAGRHDRRLRTCQLRIQLVHADDAFRDPKLLVHGHLAVIIVDVRQENPGHEPARPKEPLGQEDQTLTELEKDQEKDVNSFRDES